MLVVPLLSLTLSIGEDQTKQGYMLVGSTFISLGFLKIITLFLVLETAVTVQIRMLQCVHF